MKAHAAVPGLALVAILATALPAHAQDEVEPPATIRLISQTPWTTPNDPVLRIRVQIRNDGDTTIEAPELGWTLGGKIGAREGYEQALVDGPTSFAAGDTRHLEDPLQPGARREELLEVDTSLYGAIDPLESGVYPLQLELGSEEVELAAVTTAAIHITQPPQKRVRFSWWTEIEGPIAFAPDGRLIDTRFEDSLESEGGIAAQVGAIAEIVADARASDRALPIVDLVVAPATLDQLEQASDGYQRAADGTTVTDDAKPAVVAAETLRQLRELATSPEVRFYATPFAAPRLPSLLTPTLRPHLAEQWRLGDETFERLLEEPPAPGVARPPGLALDEAALDALADQGVEAILGASDSVERPTDELDLAPPPAARISTAAGNEFDVLLPDPSTQALLADRDLRTADPVRAAQVVLGELATIWRELPVPADPEFRGLALDLPRDLPAAMWGPLLRRLTSAPFLLPVHAQDLPTEIHPEPEPAVLDGRQRGAFSDLYVSDLLTTAADVDAFASIVEEPAGEAERLHRAILYAEASQYIGDETAGRMWIEAVNEVTRPTFAALAPDTSRVLTFTSRTGRIPLRMGDPGDRVVRVRIELRSVRVDFLGAGTRTVRLDQPNEVVTFDAEVRAAGPSSIEVFVWSPSGVELSRSVLRVNSTAINPIALIITIGAGLVLVGLWSRRLFRRRSP
jgi:hypothetical protein